MFVAAGINLQFPALKLPSLIILFATLSLVSAFAQEAQSLVPIDFPTDSTFLPYNWTKAPIHVEIQPLDKAMQEQAKRIIVRGLNKYPPAFAAEYLKGVSIVASLGFYGVSYGGTYMPSSKKILLVYEETFDSQGFEQRLHHEFSSILLEMNQTSFEDSRWISSNPVSFQYRAAGIIEEQNGQRPEATKVLAAEQQKTGGTGSSLLRLNPQLMEEGFLTPYNRISIEQDVNETAAHLFTNPEIWHFCQTYPSIDQKIDVLIDFYRTLSPEMDRLYFRKLTAKSPPSPQK